MKKLFFITILISLCLVLSLVSVVFANSGDGHKSEIEEGKKMVESRVSCDKLIDEQLEAIGEYLMEQMHPGESHETMHKMMGMEEGTEYHKQFHVNIAKMMYCGESGTMGAMPMMNMMNMMNMMGGDGNSTMGNMMNGGNWGLGSGWSWLGWIFMILFWVLIIAGIVVLITWLVKQVRESPKEKSALDILKERYAKGEIDRKEFEEKKKELF